MRDLKVQATSQTRGQTFEGIIKLTRWQEYVTWVIPLTLVGALLAIQSAEGQTLDLRLIAVTLANIFVVAYAFMINDIEDAPDDALDPKRAARNPVTSGLLTRRFGYVLCAATALVTMALYATGGTLVFITGAVTLLLSHLYSWKPVRLKAYPVTDILSHSLMLSGLLFMAGYLIYHSEPGAVWFVALAVTLFSVYGQLYNQVRDYDMDKAAGLWNTAIILGEKNTYYAIYLTIFLALVSMVVAVLQNIFPLWLAIPLIASIIGVAIFYRPKTDMRGGETTDFSGTMQLQGVIVINVTMFAWLGAVLLQQFNLIA